MTMYPGIIACYKYITEQTNVLLVTGFKEFNTWTFFLVMIYGTCTPSCKNETMSAGFYNNRVASD